MYYFINMHIQSCHIGEYIRIWIAQLCCLLFHSSSSSLFFCLFVCLMVLFCVWSGAVPLCPKQCSMARKENNTNISLWQQQKKERQQQQQTATNDDVWKQWAVANIWIVIIYLIHNNKHSNKYFHAECSRKHNHEICHLLRAMVHNGSRKYNLRFSI